MKSVDVRLNQAEIANMMRGTDGPAWIAAQRLGNQVRNLARENDKGYVPVREGKLRASIELEMRNEGGPVAYVGSNVEYAIFVHEGTRRQRANKFLLRALNDVMARSKGR